ncbi:MAG: pyridoxamine 5'-phosphate oxidase family protein [Verrucomicrobiota bacterium]
MITKAVADCIEESVLCWFATVSKDGAPNVSPKEAFMYDGNGKIFVANIASPKTQTNLQYCDRVCVSFINVFTQRGYKVEGVAQLLKKHSRGFEDAHAKLVAMIGDVFRIASIFEVNPVSVSEILAPSYRLFPDSDPIDRIRDSLKSYQVFDYLKKVEKSSNA